MTDSRPAFLQQRLFRCRCAAPSQPTQQLRREPTPWPLVTVLIVVVVSVAALIGLTLFLSLLPLLLQGALHILLVVAEAAGNLNGGHAMAQCPRMAQFRLSNN